MAHRQARMTFFGAGLLEPRVTSMDIKLNQTDAGVARERVVDTMIDLARVARSHRIIAVGADGLRIHRVLYRRGFARCATASTCGTSRGQYLAAFIAGDRSYPELEASLVRVSPFLNATATIVVSIESEENGLSFRVHAKLEQLGFRIEAGVRCQQALLLSAYRCNFAAIAKAA
jgi:acetolactate synthase regulatory subunit